MSDRCHGGEAKDESGPALNSLIKSNFNPEKIVEAVVPDEKSQIEETLKDYCDLFKVDCIFTTGGTGERRKLELKSPGDTNLIDLISGRFVCPQKIDLFPKLHKKKHFFRLCTS